MIRNPEWFDARQRQLSQPPALSDEQQLARGMAVFVALWRHAEAIGDLTHDHWREDVEPDIAMARILNHDRIRG